MPITSTEAPSGKRHRDLAGLGVLLFAGINVNGIFLLLFRVQGMLSPLILCLVLLLLLRYARSSLVTGIYGLYATFLISYLAFASLASLTGATFDQDLFIVYAASLLLVSASYFWLAGCYDEELENILRMFKGILLVSCICTLLTPILGQYLNYVGPQDRASGLFENPNQAGLAALYCLVLVAAYPAHSRLITLAQGAIAVMALTVTFSKAGILTFVLLSALFLAQRRSFLLLWLATIACALANWGLWYIFDNDLFDLSRDQRERIADILNIFGGEISARTTTGRTELWDFGLRRIWEQLPWGAGLTEFHALEGGYRQFIPSPDGRGVQPSAWLGVHNAFLMVLGEAGLLSFLLLVAFMAKLFLAAWRAPEKTIAVGFSVCLFVDMLSSHGALGFRLSTITLGVAMAVCARPYLQKKKSRAPHPPSSAALHELPGQSRHRSAAPSRLPAGAAILD